MVKPTYIIAEAGVNHNGQLSLAKTLVDIAIDAGADAVKFQTFDAAAMVSEHAPKAAYQKKATPGSESQRTMLKKLELNLDAHLELKQHAEKQGIEFISTPFDLPSVNLLSQKLGLSKLKIGSGDVDNGPLLLSAAQTQASIILSSGMSTLADIENALAVLAFGYCYPAQQPDGLAAMRSVMCTQEGQIQLAKKVSLLHCTSAYPASAEDMNLRAIDTLSQAFQLPVGLSDHSLGIHMPIAAVARGAQIIEKHITFDKTAPGPDHQASLMPDELCQMVKAIREVERALGTGLKQPTASEIDTRCVARKSLFADSLIEKGEALTAENVTCKRPGTGRSPMQFWDVLKHPATQTYQADELIV